MRRNPKKSGDARLIDLNSSHVVCPETGEKCGRYEIFKVVCDNKNTCYVLNQRKAQEVKPT